MIKILAPLMVRFVLGTIILGGATLATLAALVPTIDEDCMTAMFNTKHLAPARVRVGTNRKD